MTKARKKADVTPIKKQTDLEKSSMQMLSPFEEMERMMENFFPRNFMHPTLWERPSWAHLPKPFEGRMPKVDVIDRDNEVLVRAELPGVNKDDIEVLLADNTVTIKGSTKAEHKEEKGEYFHREISQGSFSRTVTLPCDVDSDHSTAKFSDSILELTLPKVEKSRKKNIKID